MQLRRIRDYAADASLLDRNTSWGREEWFKSKGGEYLLCADDCSPNNEVLGIDIRYAILFKPTPEGGWHPVTLARPQCHK